MHRLSSTRVFICYCNRDKALAKKVCHGLETRGTLCWLSARDIATDRTPTVKSAAQVISETLCAASTCLVVLTDAAATSAQVLREVELATAHDLNIVVLNCSTSGPKGSLQALLDGAIWVPCPKSDLKSVMPALLRTIRPAGEDSTGRSGHAIGKARRIPARAAQLLTSMLLGLPFVVFAWWVFVWNGGDGSLSEQRLRDDAKTAQPVSNDAVERSATPFRSLELENSAGVKLRRIPPGHFDRSQYPSHQRKQKIILTRAFWIATTELTRAQYRRVMGLPPPADDEADLPMTDISWEEANQFCATLSKMPAEAAAGRVYRLPTEAEWEYACRAGTVSTFFSGDQQELLDFFAWTNANSRSTVMKVAQKRSNAWGLYDMHGNVWELCSDWAAEYPLGVQQDPTGPAHGQFRVIRGGGVNDEGLLPGSSVRGTCNPSIRYDWIGIRLAMDLATDAPALAPRE